MKKHKQAKRVWEVVRMRHGKQAVNMPVSFAQAMTAKELASITLKLHELNKLTDRIITGLLGNHKEANQ